MNLKIFTDGGSRGNPGPAACGFVVYDEVNLREKCGKYLGIITNNEAEYAGIIEALKWLQNERLETDRKQLEIDFYLDSLLVVQQLNGVWKIKEVRLRELFLEVKKLENQITNLYPLIVIRYTHVPRAQNKEADLMVNETLDKN